MEIIKEQNVFCHLDCVLKRGAVEHMVVIYFTNMFASLLHEPENIMTFYSQMYPLFFHFGLDKVKDRYSFQSPSNVSINNLRFVNGVV